LFLLEKALVASGEYICISLSFEGVGAAMFESDENFCREFVSMVAACLRTDGHEFADDWRIEREGGILQLSNLIDEICADKKVVLMIDEVDATSRNNVFLRFLGMLRNLYLQRARDKANTFHSVILAGVTDIKNIKQKLITAGMHALEHNEGGYNSPWNIAAKFDVDMFFTPPEIATMLEEYETDHRTGMDISAVSEEVFRFTGGYPFWVSRICRCLDEELEEWTVTAAKKAVNLVTHEKNTLVDDLSKNLENNNDVYEMMFS
jgi:hypothetical protein